MTISIESVCRAGIISSIFLIGCSDPALQEGTEPSSDEQPYAHGLELATSALEGEARRLGLNINFLDKRLMPDGTFHHLRAKLGVPGKLSQKVSVDAAGRISTMSAGAASFQEEYVQEYGKLEYQLAAWIEANPDEAQSAKDLAIWYDADQLSRQQLQALSGAAPGDVTFSSSHSMVQVRMRPQDALRLAHHPGVMVVTGVGKVEDQGAADAGSVSAAYVGSDNVQNSYGVFGDGVGVAIVESIAGQANCAVFEAHESMAYANIDYLAPPTPCTNNSQCSSCDRIFTQGQCINNMCTDAKRHAEHVMSRVSSSVPGTPLHAAKVNFLVANDGTNLLNSAQFDNLLANIVASNDPEVSIMNMSAGTSNGFETYDIIRGWYARYEDLTIVKASGNHGGDGQVDCEALNIVCVGSSNAQGSYDDDFLDDSFSSSSAWINPLYSPSHPNSMMSKEVEKPDVVSEGENAKVMDRSGGENAWTTNDGTSFATPVISGLAAMIHQQCGGTVPPHLTRAILRTSAWRSHFLEDNSNDPAYPTPDQHDDSFAGTGISHAEGVSLFCGGPAQPGIGTGQGTGDDDPTDDSGWVDIPGWMHPEVFFPNPEAGLPAVPHTIKQELRSSTISKARPLWQIGRANRVRFTYSFYSCPPTDNSGQVDYSTGGPFVLEPTVDYDILLCADAVQECITVSETLDDTNEGFDVEVPDHLKGEPLTIWRTKPSASQLSDTCNGPNGILEPWAWAGVYWY